MEENPQVFFCCCEGNYCNERFTHLPDIIDGGNRGAHPENVFSFSGWIGFLEAFLTQ